MSDEIDLENTELLADYLQHPLIWTSKGNMPVADLQYITTWTVTDNSVQFVEEYFYGTDLVRRNVHNYAGGLNG